MENDDLRSGRVAFAEGEPWRSGADYRGVLEASAVGASAGIVGEARVSPIFGQDELRLGCGTAFDFLLSCKFSAEWRVVAV